LIETAIDERIKQLNPLTPDPSPPASSLLGERGDRVVLFCGVCIERAKTYVFPATLPLTILLGSYP
jgi:hypothetical protein